MTEDLRNLLTDIEYMVRKEVAYIRTGLHNGTPMRDCVGQWQSLADAARRLLDAERSTHVSD
jgi:hypothetical protein